MTSLRVAISEKGSSELFSRWDELSAGAWRKRIEVHYLTDKKSSNDAIVLSLARSQGTVVYTAQHLTSSTIARQQDNVRRFPAHKLKEAVNKWLDESDLDWRARTKRNCDKTSFTSISAEEWVSQFAKVNPAIGRKAGAALLSQFRVVAGAELADCFSDLPRVDHNSFFIGADPHSGDHALIAILAARIDNEELHDSRRLPSMKKDATVRLFCDGSWSGGETSRRIRCMFTSCDKKEIALASNHHLDVRVGFMTDAAQTTINRELQSLVDDGMVKQGFVRVACPEGNRLPLVGYNSGQKGLAFHDLTLLQYVDADAKALQKLCLEIGKQVQPDAPLGTNNIASCIAFWHSLPAAMLPLFTVADAEVTSHSGEKFIWKSLLPSKHALTGQDDDPEHHCGECPLGKRSPRSPRLATNDGLLASAASGKPESDGIDSRKLKS